MPSYLLVYHGGGMPETEEQQEQVMAAWTVWFDELGAALVDGGNPVGKAMTIDSDGNATAGGGVNPSTGYSIISAESLDEAVAMSRGCPIVTTGGSVEVCETFEVM